MAGTSKKYIVRIYRLEGNNPRSVVGLAEDPEREMKRAFTSVDELWRILNPGKGPEGAERQRRLKERKSV